MIAPHDDPDEPCLQPTVAPRAVAGDVHDKPFYRRSAFYKMLTGILTAVTLYFPEWDARIKVAIAVVENIALFFVIDQLTYSPDPKEFIRKGGTLLERDGERVSPSKIACSRLS